MRRLLALVPLALILVGCASEPAPAPTVTVVVRETVTVAPVAPEPAPEPVEATTEPGLTDGQRATLDTTFGKDWGDEGPLGTYCPMDDGGRRYYAELVARQIDGLTENLVMQYLAETC